MENIALMFLSISFVIIASLFFLLKIINVIYNRLNFKIEFGLIDVLILSYSILSAIYLLVVFQ